MQEKTNTRGGSRRGAGRPRKGKELRVPLCFSVDPRTKARADKLRAVGYNITADIELSILKKYGWFFDNDPED